MTKKERSTRIIARGEVSGHSHIVTGNADVYVKNKQVFINAKDDNCVIKHLLEQPFVEEGKEVWTKEHTDIPLRKGLQRYVPQLEYNPMDKLVQKVND